MGSDALKTENKTWVVALAGNPNSGKTTLFNQLTGSSARVGNWSGVTVEKREGVCRVAGGQVRVIDLPGLYSLAPYSPEERLARNVLLHEHVDGIIHIVDATNLERSLYLTTQLLELDVPLIVALNMVDILDARGDVIQVRELERRFGVPVVEISARNRTHIDTLLARTLQTMQTPRKGRCVLHSTPVYPAVAFGETLLAGKANPLFHAVKLAEGDALSVSAFPREAQAVRAFMANMKEDLDGEAVIADGRYAYVTESVAHTLSRGKAQTATTRTEKLDRVLTHKWWGIPIFIGVLLCIFHTVFADDVLFLGRLIPAFGAWCQKAGGAGKSILFGRGINALGVILKNALSFVTAGIEDGARAGLSALGASPIVIGLLCDGILGGLFSVLHFLPQMLLLFFLFSLIEDSGYMARIAFMLDKIFRPFGISGRAFMPMVMGLGCSVPAILNTRTLASEKERLATVRVIPFFPCGAKLPVLLTVTGVLAQSFGVGMADILVGCVYALCILVAMLALLVMHNRAGESTATPFIMELPPYRMPSGKSTASLLWEKTKHFLEKAFTVIALSTLAVWVFTHFTWGWRYTEGALENSVLACLGKFLSPLFIPLGFGQSPYGWVFTVATLTGLIAKENIVATLVALAVGICPSAGGENALSALLDLGGTSMPAVLSFIVFNMLTLPCIATLSTARAELGKTEMWRTVFFWLVTAYAVSGLVYTVGLTPWAWLGWIAFAGVAWRIIRRKPARRVEGTVCAQCKKCKR